MALTASVSLNPSSTITKDKVIQALVILSNSDTVNPITITNIVPQCAMAGDSIENDNPSSTRQICLLPLSPIVPVKVGLDNGTLSIQFPISFHAPSNTFTNYSVSALIYSADGQIVQATPATIAVTNP